MTGGKGADTFAFGFPGNGEDALIIDFESNVTASVAADLIRIEVPGSDGAWIGAEAFDAASPQARFDAAAKTVQIDSDGDGTANFSIALSGVTDADQLTGTDFLFA